MVFFRSPRHRFSRFVKRSLIILELRQFGLFLGVQCIGWGFVIIVSKQNMYWALCLILTGILLLVRSPLVKVYYETKKGRRERKLARKKKRSEKREKKKRETLRPKSSPQARLFSFLELLHIK
jgi:hypothetical protein